MDLRALDGLLCIMRDSIYTHVNGSASAPLVMPRLVVPGHVSKVQ